MITRTLKHRFVRPLVYLVCALMVLAGDPLLALDQNVRIVPKDEQPDWLETWTAGDTYRDAWDATASWSRDSISDLEQRLGTWWDGTWESSWRGLPESVAQSPPTVRAATAFAEQDGDGGASDGEGAGSGEGGGERQSLGLTEEELRQLTLTDAVGFEDDESFKTLPLPEIPGQKSGASDFRPPEELIQLMAGKATLDGTPLIPGWNLLSTPEEPVDTDPGVVLSSIAGAYTRAYAYENCDTADPWKVYDPNDLSNSELTAIDHKIGFWLEATSAVELPFDGTLPATTDIPICPGWNLIGYPAGEPRHVTNALHTIEGKYIRVFGFDATDADDPWEVYSVGVPHWANDLQEMVPGRGYWLLATEAATLTIANEGPDPVVEITSPDDLGVVTDFTDIVGTVQSPILDSWRLTYERIGETEPIELASGIAPVAAGGVLGTFDPTLLINGLYELKLEAIDLEGRIVEDSIAVAVEGNMKIGHFTLSFVDLAIPLSGLDIEIVRTYDSRRKDELLDFGHGWSLDIRQGSYQNNRPPGDGWEIVNPGGPFGLPCSQTLETKSHLTTVRLSDQEIYRFRLSLIETAILLEGCQARAVFDWVDGPLPGTTLEVLGDNRVIYENGSDRLIGWDSLELFEPEKVKLTTRDGRIFVLDLGAGVTHLEDRNGNSVDITVDGITHSSGVGIDFQRDGSGRIFEIIDPAGETLTYRYDQQDDLVALVDRVQSTYGYGYQAGHYLAQLIDPEGRAVGTAQYADDGRVERFCDTQLRCTVVEHDLDQNQERHTDPTARVTTFRYDARGNVVAAVDGFGYEWLFEYDQKDRMTRSIDPEGGVSIWSFDSEGDLVSFVTPYSEGADPADHTTTMTYDSSGNITSATRPDGSTWKYFYDDRGNQTRVEDGIGNVLRSATYNSKGQVTSESDRFGTLTYQDLNQFGEPTRALDADGTETVMTYSPYGEIESMISGGSTWTFGYDAAGREASADYGNGLVHTIDYDSSGRMIAEENSLTGRVARNLDESGNVQSWQGTEGRGVSYERDAAGRMTRQTDSEGVATEYQYDSAGRVATISHPSSGARHLERDRAGRVTKVTDALDHETTYGYYPDGKLAWQKDHLQREWRYAYGTNWIEVTDSLSRTTRAQLGPEGEVTEITHPDGAIETVSYLDGTPQGEREAYPTSTELPGGQSQTWTYDSLGRLDSATDLGGNVWTYDVATDGFSETVRTPSGDVVVSDALTPELELASRQYGDGGTYLYQYGLAFDPTQVTKPSGVEIDYQYDANGQVASRVSSDGESETLAWNSLGAPVQTSDATGTTSWTYDATGRPASMTHSDGSGVAWSWDEVGRMKACTVTLPDGSTAITQYRYNEADELVEVEQDGVGLMQFGYDDGGRVTSRTLPNGLTTSWEYDLRDRILAVEHSSNGTVVASYRYTRGEAGEVLRVKREDGSTVEWDYDAAFRVSEERRYEPGGSIASTASWTWDAAGNRISETRDGVTEEAGHLPGQRLSEVAVAGTPTETYAWDADGRIEAIDRDGSSIQLGYDTKDALRSVAVDGTTITYGHDAMGRRRSASDGTTTREFVVAPSAPGGLDVVWAIGDGSQASRFVWAGNRPLARVDDDGTVRWLLEDGLGSIVGHADETGNLVATRDWDAFGNLAGSTGEPAPSHLGGGFGLRAEWREASTGFYHLRARDYDPHTGQFLSRDPAGGDKLDPVTFHPYLFAYGNPLSYHDPTGLFGVTEVNITISVQNSISSARTYALNEIRREIVEDIREFMVDLLVDAVLAWLGPGLSGFSKGTLAAAKAGFAFEEMAQDLLCQVVPVSAVHFEVGINEGTGKAVDNGYGGCPPERRNFAGVKRTRRPDFLLNTGSPKKGDKSLLIGEIKLGIGTFYRAWKKKRRGQWNAIHMHSKDHAYFPKAVFLVAFDDGKPYQQRFLIGLLRNGGHYGIILTIL